MYTNVLHNYVKKFSLPLCNTFSFTKNCSGFFLKLDIFFSIRSCWYSCLRHMHWLSFPRILIILLRPLSDDDDDDDLFLWYGWPVKSLISSRDHCLTIANLRHAASRVWTCAELEFRFNWMKLCSSNNHYTKAPWHTCLRTYFSRMADSTKMVRKTNEKI